MMCRLIGGGDKVWWGQYLLNSLVCYLDNAGEEQNPLFFPILIHSLSQQGAAG